MVVVFAGARALTKIGASRLAARANHAMEELGRDWGFGLLGHGGLAVALALNYLIQGEPLANLVFTATITSVLLTDVFSARIVRALVPRNQGGRAKPGAATASGGKGADA